ncbi:hypothetical protein [Vibrio mediterranei]|nr:hypothetical protein [Vibrio mediterranei]
MIPDVACYFKIFNPEPEQLYQGTPTPPWTQGRLMVLNVLLTK